MAPKQEKLNKIRRSFLRHHSNDLGGQIDSSASDKRIVVKLFDNYRLSETSKEETTNDDHGEKEISAKNFDPLNSFTYPNYGSIDGSGADDRKLSDDSNGDGVINVASIIGDIGWFQLLVLIFSGLRECTVGYDALITSIMLQPETGYICTSGFDIDENDPGLRVGGRRHGGYYSYQHDGGVNSNDTAACSYFRDNGQNKTEVACDTWVFKPSEPAKASLIVDWSLVCDRSFYPAFIESSFFMGLVLGNIIWGYMADRIGRKKAYIISHLIAMIAGILSLLVSDVRLFALFRFLAAIGSIGYNILYTIQMELIGTKYRSYATMFNHLGWGMGAISIPLMASLTTSTKIMLSVTPLIAIFMLPWAFWIPESSRWLMAHGRFSKARKELIRAAKFNGKEIDAKLENLIVALNDKIVDDKCKQQNGGNQLIASQSIEAIRKRSCSQTTSLDSISRDDLQIVVMQQPRNGSTRNDKQNELTKVTNESDQKSLSSLSSSQNSSAASSEISTYRILCSNPIIIRDTVIIAYSSFTGHLFYYLLTINFADMKNLSIEANFISSGAGEWFSLIVGSVLLRCLSRRTCMSICSFTMASSFIFQCLIDSDIAPQLNTTLMGTRNNTIGTVSSLLLVFVVLIVNQEVYPTVIRQTGSSIGNTLGELGSTLAPWLIQLNRSIGLWRADILAATMCITGMIGAQFLTRTDNIELEDV